jgi:7,8-dihydropterin-6-yl-methyl-4-(beta-D-ribofuranosyl)aminobenzene 5'-phosphate synthase
MSATPKPVEKVEIITLEDNYVDLTSMDSTAVVLRAVPLRGTTFANTILAEHGFSAVIRVTDKGKSRMALLDFGMSADAAARNSKTLSLDMSQVEVAALSHGHIDHFGGMKLLGLEISQPGTPLVVHPSAFKPNRYLEPFPGFQVDMPALTRQDVAQAGFKVKETKEPMLLMDGEVLFLGEIPRKNDFEKGMPNAFYKGENGNAVWDPIEDDTALVANLAGKGLVILSGCAHSGIANTLTHARQVTGIDKIHAVMGGFHLSGPVMAPVIEPTIKALKEADPDFVIPTHCTGRNAVAAFEKAFGEKFLLNMSGTTLVFT